MSLGTGRWRGGFATSRSFSSAIRRDGPRRCSIAGRTSNGRRARSCANGYRQNEPEATEQLYREIAPTFVEDKDMVEAQQARLDELGEQGLVNIVSDTNRVVMRRFIERLLAEEKGALAAE